jgi:hypothetical protein
MLNDPFMNRIWIPVSLWILLYTSDYLLTIAGARIYATGAREHFEYPGGYELNPYFAQDVARLQWFSFRFVMALILYGGLLLACSIAWRELFALSWGSLIFPLLVVLVRHVRNVVFFYHVKRTDGVQGRVCVAHWLSLRSSAAEWFSFGVVFLFLYLLTASLPVAGGAIGCMFHGIRSTRSSVKSRRAQPISNL